MATKALMYGRPSVSEAGAEGTVVAASVSDYGAAWKLVKLRAKHTGANWRVGIFLVNAAGEHVYAGGGAALYLSRQRISGAIV